jgi:hypothetical protein
MLKICLRGKRAGKGLAFCIVPLRSTLQKTLSNFLFVFYRSIAKKPHIPVFGIPLL